MPAFGPHQLLQRALERKLNTEQEEVPDKEVAAQFNIKELVVALALLVQVFTASTVIHSWKFTIVITGLDKVDRKATITVEELNSAVWATDRLIVASHLVQAVARSRVTFEHSLILLIWFLVLLEGSLLLYSHH